MISSRPHHRKLQDTEKRRRRREKEKLLRKIAKLRADFQKLQDMADQGGKSDPIPTDDISRAIFGASRARPRPPVTQPAPGIRAGWGSPVPLIIPVFILLMWIAYLIAKGGPAQ